MLTLIVNPNVNYGLKLMIIFGSTSIINIPHQFKMLIWGSMDVLGMKPHMGLFFLLNISVKIKTTLKN